MISVLGTGVAGLCAATALSEAGIEVELIVPEGAPAPVSHLAGGMLAPFCEGESAPKEVVTRGQGAPDWWQGRGAEVKRRGTLVLAPARDRGELDRFARATRTHQWVRPDDLEPDLSGRFAKGLFFGREAHLDPAQALGALRSRLAARGVVARAARPRGRIVDCRGWAARHRLRDLRAVRGEMIEVYAPDVAVTRTVRLLHPRFPCYIVPRGGGRYVIGATMVESARGGGVTVRSMMELLSAAHAVHPGFAEAEILSHAAGLRPAFPDNLPRLRQDGNRIHMNGMYRHGFLMAPSLARDLLHLLTQESTHAH